MAHQIKELEVAGYEDVRYCVDKEVGLEAIIAVHNTALGKAMGGTRLWPYNSFKEAYTDVLRLSKGMTRKAAMANLPAGGGKGVIITDQKRKTPELLKSYARFVNTFDGKFSTGADVGIGLEEVNIIKEETNHVSGILRDPCDFTAYGVLQGMLAAVCERYGASTSITELRIAVQGVGGVGYQLVKQLNELEAYDLTVTDIDEKKMAKAFIDFKVRRTEPDEIYANTYPIGGYDIFAPCALGATLNSLTIPLLKCNIVAGAANNQLDEDHWEDLGWKLMAKDILYIPDYVINAGGLIYIYMEKHNRSTKDAWVKATKIGSTVTEVIEASKRMGIPSQEAANIMADDKIRAAERSQDRSGWM